MGPGITYKPTVEDIKQLFPGAKMEVIQTELPIMLRALSRKGLDKDPRVLAYIFATNYVENGSFDSRRDEYGHKGKRYSPFYGRGNTQLTWDYNYKNYGKKIGKDLFHNPDLMHDPNVDFAVMAEFHAARLPQIMKAVESGDLVGIRRSYNGGSNGLSALQIKYQQALERFVDREVSPQN